MGMRQLKSSLAALCAALLMQACLASAEGGSNVKLLSSARRLEDGANDDEYEFDLSSFSLRFDMCQHIKMYDDEAAQDGDASSPLIVKHLAVFRLCPSDSCGSCSSVFGQYAAEVDDYLQYTVAAQQQAFETMCENCNEKCNGDGEYCSGCGKLCYTYDNLEAQGYVDAANYIQCQQVANNNNNNNGGGDDDGNQLYIGPRCSADGSRILIGLFSDEECLEPYTSEDVEDYLGAKISYHVLAHTHGNDGDNCLSCLEDEGNNNNNQGDANDVDDVNEMCESIYDISAKCESKNGITGGFIQTKRDEDDYENQVENEYLVCNFIQSLLWNSYTETGEINTDDEQDVTIREVTELQTVSALLLSLTLLGLIGAVVFTNKQIENASPRVDLACRSDGELA